MKIGFFVLSRCSKPIVEDDDDDDDEGTTKDEHIGVVYHKTQQTTKQLNFLSLSLLVSLQPSGRRSRNSPRWKEKKVQRVQDEINNDFCYDSFVG